MRYFYLFIVLMMCLSCDTINEFLPKGKYKLDDLHNVPIYGILYICTGKEDRSITECVGGIKDGKFYCNNEVFINCPKGDKKIFTAYDISSRSKLEAYILYLFKRFQDE